MKDTARSRARRQEAPHIGQLAVAAMLDARATLRAHDATLKPLAIDDSKEDA